MRRSNCALMSTMNDGFTSAYRLAYRIFDGRCGSEYSSSFFSPARKHASDADLRAAVVVRMAPLPVGQNHHARLQLADLHRHGHARAERVFQPRVRHVHVAAPVQPHVLAGRLRFCHALLGRAARAHVAGRQVEHAGAVSHLGHADQGAAAGLLHIVGMRRDRQNVQAHARAASLLRNSFISTLYLKPSRD